MSSLILHFNKPYCNFSVCCKFRPLSIFLLSSCKLGVFFQLKLPQLVERDGRYTENCTFHNDLLFVLFKFLNVSWFLVELSLELILTNNLISSPSLISEYKGLASVTGMASQPCYVYYTPKRAGQLFNCTFFFCKWQKRKMEEAPQSEYLELWWKRKQILFSVENLHWKCTHMWWVVWEIQRFF